MQPLDGCRPQTCLPMSPVPSPGPASASPLPWGSAMKHSPHSPLWVRCALRVLAGAEHGDTQGLRGQGLPFTVQGATGPGMARRPHRSAPQQWRGRRDRAAGRALTFTPSFFLLPPLLPPGERRKEIRRARQGTRTSRARSSSMVSGCRIPQEQQRSSSPTQPSGAQGRPSRPTPVAPSQGHDPSSCLTLRAMGASRAVCRGCWCPSVVQRCGMGSPPAAL